jgi:hypothetical protein
MHQQLYRSKDKDLTATTLTVLSLITEQGGITRQKLMDTFESFNTVSEGNTHYTKKQIMDIVDKLIIAGIIRGGKLHEPTQTITDLRAEIFKLEKELYDLFHSTSVGQLKDLVRYAKFAIDHEDVALLAEQLVQKANLQVKIGTAQQAQQDKSVDYNHISDKLDYHQFTDRLGQYFEVYELLMVTKQTDGALYADYFTSPYPDFESWANNTQPQKKLQVENRQYQCKGCIQPIEECASCKITNGGEIKKGLKPSKYKPQVQQ